MDRTLINSYDLIPRGSKKCKKVQIVKTEIYIEELNVTYVYLHRD